jgi:membrane-bound lytic murein transglycosylase B
VPAEVILGILGVETAYGRNTGSFRAIDALATIAFDGVRRQDYFRDELKHLLLLARERGNSPADAIGSIGRYLKTFGWVPGERPKAPVRLAPGSEPELVSGLERVHDVMDVQAKGVIFSGREPPAGPISIFELPAPGQPSKFFAGFANFEAVTRYNRSTFYASAVLELGDAIGKAHRRMQLASNQAGSGRSLK